MAGVDGDLAQRSLDRATHDVDTAGLIVVGALHAVQRAGGIEQRRAAARNNAFFHRSAGGVQGIINAVLAFLHFDFGAATNLQNSHTASQLGQTLLQLLTVIIAGGHFDLGADLFHTGLDGFGRTFAINNDRVVLVDGDALGLAQHRQGDVFQLDAQVFADHLASRQDGDIFQHGLAAIAKARRLDRSNLQATAQLVDHQGGQRFAFNVFGNDQQRAARLHHGFQHRQHRLQAGQLLFVDQDVGVVEFHLHLFGIGDEIGAQIATVELHAFDHVQLAVHALGFFNRDHAFLADLFHGLGNHRADFGFAVGRDGADLGDFARTGHRLGTRLQIFHNLGHGHVDAALQVHRVHAGGNRLHAFAHDGLGQHGGGGGAVTGSVVGLRGHFAHHLGAQILELVLQFDFLGNRHTVLGDARRAKALFDDDVAALGAQRHLHGIGEDINTADDALTRVAAELHVLGSHWLYS